MSRKELASQGIFDVSSARDIYTGIAQDDAAIHPAVSPYGQTNPEESFAEMYAYGMSDEPILHTSPIGELRSGVFKEKIKQHPFGFDFDEHRETYLRRRDNLLGHLRRLDPSFGQIAFGSEEHPLPSYAIEPLGYVRESFANMPDHQIDTHNMGGTIQTFADGGKIAAPDPVMDNERGKKAVAAQAWLLPHRGQDPVDISQYGWDGVPADSTFTRRHSDVLYPGQPKSELQIHGTTQWGNRIGLMMSVQERPLIAYFSASQKNWTPMLGMIDGSVYSMPEHLYKDYADIQDVINGLNSSYRLNRLDTKGNPIHIRTLDEMINSLVRNYGQPIHPRNAIVEMYGLHNAPNSTLTFNTPQEKSTYVDSMLQNVLSRHQEASYLKYSPGKEKFGGVLHLDPKIHFNQNSGYFRRRVENYIYEKKLFCLYIYNNFSIYLI
jgi:hypothetical protein